MEATLESLIEKIEREAVDEADKKAQELLDAARREAEVVVREAQEKAERLTSEARKEAEKTKRAGEAALKQSARDAELRLKESVTDLFDRVFLRELVRTLEPAFLKELILTITSQWARDPAGFELTLTEEDKQDLEALLFDGMRQELADTVSLDGGGHDGGAGFRLRLRAGEVFYDFTSAAIKEILWSNIGPRLREILDGDAERADAKEH